MKGIYSWVWMITGVVPAIGVVLCNVGTPEELKNKFAIYAAVAGITAAGVTMFITASAKRKNKRLSGAIVMVLGLIGLFAFCSYSTLLGQCAFKSADRTSVFFPLWLSGTAKEEIKIGGGRKAFYEKYGAGAVAAILASQRNELMWTELLLAGLIVTASVTLPAAIGVSSTWRDTPLTPGHAKKQAPRGHK
jgi:hypothetical protein